MSMPHDVTDLYLAPVLLRVDAELQSLADKTEQELQLLVAIRTNSEPRGQEQRRTELLNAILEIEDLHGWSPSWDERGLRLTNDEHSVVLGAPAVVRAYAGLATLS